MEVALRVFSWTFALYHLRDSRALSESRWQRWQESLRDHAKYVRVCLEFEVPGNGNHYVANLLGLAAVERGLASSISPRRIASL